MQVALRRRELRVALYVLDGDDVNPLDRQAAEGVSQIVEASDPNFRGLLGTDEALADNGAVERAAVTSAKDEVGAELEGWPFPEGAQLRRGLFGQRDGAEAPPSCSSPRRWTSPWRPLRGRP